ncbi:hypothetical protein B2K_24065 [Paenibacillus mucilaginosus K02]|uniref:Spore germination protein n=2 Tax=Paenibacillus mucilaginosus TaxID=61624 RepID=I0BMX7_9BACL|nr:hypothetical protein B2K_24065 [Paenibacillus mucilaginosus K02]
MGAMYTFDSTLISVQAQAIGAGKQQVWISHIIAAALIAASLWLFSRAASRFPDKTLLEAMVYQRPAAGRMMALLFMAFIFFVLCHDIRMMTDFSNIILLPLTPLVIIALLVAVTSAVLAMGGLETLGRMTEIYGTILILAVVISAFIISKDVSYSNLEPFFEYDLKGIAQAAWLLLPYFGEIIIIPLIVSFPAGTSFRTLMASLSLGTGFLLLLSMLDLLSIGVPVVSKLMYPSHEMVRQIRMTDFLDRFDLVLVGIWLPTMFVKIGYSIFALCYGWKLVLGSRSGRPYVPSVALLAFVCSFWFFENAVQLVDFNRIWPAYAIFFQLLLPVLLFFLLRKRKKEEALPPEGEAARMPGS